METGKYLSRKHAAEWLDVSEKTIDRRCRAGELDSFKDGGQGPADARGPR